ncbi:MAG: rRNA maturation RNase YbeY [Candidatus Portnoybacteria bacterium]|nr:rRNA maturation RNase YbeY [Candidatus Portnoybacteria bacterium]
MRILSTNLTEKRPEIEEAIKKVSQAFDDDMEISLVLTDEHRIQEINAQYRKKNKSTDVLSFPELNEIFICPSIIKKQAKILKTPFKTELTRVIVHGILHLLGFDHVKKDQAAEMEKEEDKILKKISEK